MATTLTVDMNAGSCRSEKPVLPELAMKTKEMDLRHEARDAERRLEYTECDKTLATRSTLVAKLTKFYLKDQHDKDNPEAGFDEEEAGNVIEDDDLSSIDDNDRRYFPDNSSVNHQTTGFAYHIKKIAPRRDIRWEVDSDDLRNINLLAEGSNSHVFTAKWGKQDVIVKVSCKND
jgi:hypothetical protein